MGFTWVNGPGGGTPVSAANLNGLLQTADLDDEVAYVLGNPTSATTLAVDGMLDAKVDPLTAGRVQGASGRAYRVIAGVLRNSGSGWAFLNDSGHQPTNITSVSANSTSITINYGFTGTKVAALLVTPDETFAQDGYFAGASVGLSSSTIKIARAGRSVSDYVSYNGSTWTSLGGVFTGLSFSSGTLTLTHESITGASGAVAGRGGTYQPQLGAMSGTTTEVEFFDWAGAKITTANTNMRAYVTRNSNRQLTAVDPTTITAPTANLWVLGLIEVAP